MNIFSRFLSQWSSDDQLHQMIADWDKIEALSIQTYRTKTITAEDEQAYAAARESFLSIYEGYRDKLAPLWEKTKVGGTTEHDDPFLFVVESETLDGFLENWAALQHLPAAREALNQLIITD